MGTSNASCTPTTISPLSSSCAASSLTASTWAASGDLTDRLILADLKRITEADRRDETELEAEWLQAHPAILGGLLDLAAKVHHRLPTIRVDRLPRMADYAKVLACIDEIHHTEGLQRYRERATHLVADSVASDTSIRPVTDGRNVPVGDYPKVRCSQHISRQILVTSCAVWHLVARHLDIQARVSRNPQSTN